MLVAPRRYRPLLLLRLGLLLLGCACDCDVVVVVVVVGMAAAAAAAVADATSEDDSGRPGTCEDGGRERGRSSSSSCSSSPMEIQNGKYYCPGKEGDEDEKGVQNYDVYANLDCFHDDPHSTTTTTTSTTTTAMVRPRLLPGQIVPMVRRDTGAMVSQYAHQVGLPSGFASSLLGYVDRMGFIDELVRHHRLVSSRRKEGEKEENKMEEKKEEMEADIAEKVENVEMTEDAEEKNNTAEDAEDTIVEKARDDHDNDSDDDDDEEEEEEEEEDEDENNKYTKGRIVTLANNMHWYINIREGVRSKNNSDDERKFALYTMSPFDEISHESYLNALSASNFDDVLEAIGTALELSSLAVYHVSFVAAFDNEAYAKREQHGEELGGGNSHRRGNFVPNIVNTEGTVYNVIVPLLLEYDDIQAPRMIVWDDMDEEVRNEVEVENMDERKGWKKVKYNYQLGVGVVMGDDVVYDIAHDGYNEDVYSDSTYTHHSDDCNNIDVQGNNYSGHITMRLFASVYIAEIYRDNVAQVAQGVETMAKTTIFPLRGDNDDDERWLLSYEARHWRDSTYSGIHRNGTMSNDAGRKAFRVMDALDDCYERADVGLCGTLGVDVDDWVLATRELCPLACGLYIEEGLTTDIIRLGVRDQRQHSIELCTRCRTVWSECRIYEDDVDVPGHYFSPKLQPGKLFPMIWRGYDDYGNGDEDDSEDDDVPPGTVATPYAFQIGLPPELTHELLAYCDRIGITDELRKLTGENPLPVEENIVHKFHRMADGKDWYVQRPPLKWTSNMHWISPADESTHEEYLNVLQRGKFDIVLDAIGKHLGLVSLVAYHLTFIGVSHSEKGFIHYDSINTGASVYNIIIPLILEDDATPELALIVDEDGDRPRRHATLKYKLGTAAMMGDEAYHGTEACDYRDNKGMRLAATVYVADISEKNAENIAKQTLTQIFPLADAKWLIAEAGRHWVGDNNHGREDLPHSKGRKHFEFNDLLPDCAERANEGKCISDIKVTRVKCLRSCGIYEPNLTTF